MTDSPSRRGALSLLSKAIMGTLGLVVMIPGVGFLADPLRKRGGAKPNAVRVGNAADVVAGTPVRAEVVAESRDAWLLKPHDKLGACWLVREGEHVRALSTVCPHLGCAIDWAPDKAQFDCPCHRSVFDPHGRRISGPSPRDMDDLETRVAPDGGVFVVYQRFPVGSKSRG